MKRQRWQLQPRPGRETIRVMPVSENELETRIFFVIGLVIGLLVAGRWLAAGFALVAGGLVALLQWRENRDCSSE